MAATKQIVTTPHTPVNGDFFLLVNSTNDEIHQLPWSTITNIVSGGTATPTKYVDAVVAGKKQRIGVLTNTDASTVDLSETVTNIVTTPAGFKYTNEAGQEVEIPLPTPSSVANFISDDLNNRLIVGSDDKLKVIADGGEKSFKANTFYTKGSRIDVNGSTMVASRDFDSFTTFEKDQEQSFLQQPVLDGNEAAAELGKSLAISGDGNVMIIGSPLYDNPTDGNDLQGKVFVVYRQDDNTWSPPTELSVAGVLASTEYGTDVSTNYDGSVIAISAPRHTPVAGSRGAVFIFRRAGSIWNVDSDTLVTPNSAVDSRFGSSVSLSNDGNTLAVGSPEEDTRKGKVYVFKFTTSWDTGVELSSSPHPLTNDDRFGKVVAISGNGKVVAVATDEYVQSPSPKVGACWVFVDVTSSGWELAKSVVSSIDTMKLGSDLAISDTGEVILVGLTDTSNSQAFLQIVCKDRTGDDVFSTSGATFDAKFESIAATGLASDSLVGRKVTVDSKGTRWFIGAEGSKNAAGEAVGGVLVYNFTDKEHVLSHILLPDAGKALNSPRIGSLNTLPYEAGMVYPASLDTTSNGDQFIVGVNMDANNVTDSGAVVKVHINTPRWVSAGSDFETPEVTEAGFDFAGSSGLVPMPPKANMFLTSEGWKPRRRPKITTFDFTASGAKQPFIRDPDSIGFKFEAVGGGGSQNSLYNLSRTDISSIGGGASSAGYCCVELFSDKLPADITVVVGDSGQMQGNYGTGGYSGEVSSIYAGSQVLLSAAKGNGATVSVISTSSGIIRGASAHHVGVVANGFSMFYHKDMYELTSEVGQDGKNGYGHDKAGGAGLLSAGDGGSTRWGWGGIADDASSYARGTGHLTVSHKVSGFGSGACGMSRNADHNSGYIGSQRGGKGRVIITEYF